ncbi:dynamin-related protein 5A-like [Gossypium australe]|uniref:Dynamin-related protein 5A-like n=1 Tax=Gossypium australe TaxID=47621 RepID=A0A5B6U501_9ROSI|nr:dynamin-related protein 5A-like [Gossypium australe]
MATATPTPTKTPVDKSRGSRSHHQEDDSSSSRSRFEAYNRLQAMAVAFGEKLPIPEIVALGGQSDGKSSLLEALLGFRFNVREVEMGTRRPLILQMVHDPTALEPRCRFQPIVMRAEFAHCPNLTIIDTPGFVLKAKKGEPENTPQEILSMVKSLASPPHRILLFLQQSSVEWCSSLWLDSIREIDPTFRRTVIVVSKFDNRLKEFSDRWEVDRYLSASGYLGETTRPFFVALPKDRSTVSNDEFRRQISQVDSEVLGHLHDGIKGESELQKRYKEAAPATLVLLEQRCSEVNIELEGLDSKIQATSDVSHLRKSAMMHAASISNHVVRHLYHTSAFERVMHEFRCAAYSIECPPVSREKVANILLAHAGRGGGRRVAEAAAEIARTAARSWLAPLLDTACDRLAFVLGNLFDIVIERNRSRESEYGRKTGEMEGYVGFHAALRHAYNSIIKDLAKQCKQLVRHHLDSVTSPYSQLSDCGQVSRDERMRDQENIPPENNARQKTPGKGTEARDVHRESQMTVPETPSPDQPCDGVKVDDGPRKRIARIGNRNPEQLMKVHNGGSLLFGNGDCGSRSAYTEICSLAAQHFARIREVLVERSVTSTLNSGFLTPW